MMDEDMVRHMAHRTRARCIEYGLDDTGCKARLRFQRI